MSNRSKRHRHEESEVDSEGSWAISYGDMVTLLMCFFILFFSLEQRTENKKVERAALLQRALLDAFKPTGSMKGPSEGAKSGPQTSVSVGDRVEMGIDPKRLEAFKGRAIAAGDAIIVDFASTSFFSSGAVALSAAGKEALAKFMDSFRPYLGQHVLTIQAFTDRKGVARRRGRAFRDNLELSALRAVAALRFLQAQGVPLSRMRAGGYGEMRWTLQETAKADAREPAAERLDIDRKVILVIRPEGRAEP